MVDISENDIHQLLTAFYEGVCYLNAQGEIEYYNAAAQAHWNIEQKRTHAITSWPPVIRALAGEQVYHELIQVDQHRSLLVNTSPLLSETNILRGVLITSQDVSEHVITERDAHIALDILVEALLGTSNLADINEALRRLATLLPQLASVDNSFAFRVNDSTKAITFLGLFGVSQHNDDEWRKELAALEDNAQKTVNEASPAYLQAIRMMRTIKVEFSTDAKNNNPRNLRAAIYAPVTINNHVVGLLGVERHRPLGANETYFPQWSVDLLTALARLASMSIEKTLLHESEERLKAEAATLQDLLKQKEEFLLLATHELKNPLTAILGQAQVLRRRLNRELHHDIDQQTHELIRGLESIEHQTRRITHMINTFMEVSRVELDRMDLEMYEVDLLQLVRRVLKDYLPLAPKHEMVLYVNGQWIPILSDEEIALEPILIQGDEHRLEQVINNLMSNAIKYSPEGGPVITSLRQTDDEIELVVEDRGIGVPVEEQAHLTERFYRAENAQTTTSKGLGIGLYLVNTLVKQHGGNFMVKSEGIPGKGSTFSIMLPTRNG
ncbi:MAG: sensor histidine kinase [Ktedonobacteraceae bacterium]